MSVVPQPGSPDLSSKPPSSLAGSLLEGGNFSSVPCTLVGCPARQIILEHKPSLTSSASKGRTSYCESRCLPCSVLWALLALCISSLAGPSPSPAVLSSAPLTLPGFVGGPGGLPLLKLQPLTSVTTLPAIQVSTSMSPSQRPPPTCICRT